MQETGAAARAASTSLVSLCTSWRSRGARKHQQQEQRGVGGERGRELAKRVVCWSLRPNVTQSHHLIDHKVRKTIWNLVSILQQMQQMHLSWVWVSYSIQVSCVEKHNAVTSAIAPSNPVKLLLFDSAYRCTGFLSCDERTCNKTTRIVSKMLDMYLTCVWFKTSNMFSTVDL